jgi:CubicO group peptidase (beta-lactamase class C family)
MQSGVVYDDNEHLYRAATGFEPFDGTEKVKTLHDFLTSVEADKDEKKGFNYSSVNTDLLGWAIERATGQSLAELVQVLLWQPLGAENDALLTVDSEGSPRAAGGMCLSVRDLVRLGHLISQREDQNVVPSAWIDEILTGGDKAAWNAGAWAPAFKGLYSDTAYHNCWVADGEAQVMIGLGVFGQAIMIDLKHGVVLAKTASQDTAADFARLALGVAAFKEFVRMLTE